MNKYADFSQAGKARKQMYQRLHAPGRAACIKKRAHESQERASRWLQVHGYKGKPYKCPMCHQWHATTKGAK